MGLRKKKQENSNQDQDTQVEEVQNNNENNKENINDNAENEQQLINEEIEAENEKDLKINELQDKYLRLSAEFDNFRRRSLKEKSDYFKNAEEEVLIKIIPVVDDFERALKYIDTAKDLTSIKDGIQLIYNKLKDFLNQRGVKPIESLNQEFNTDLHEALTKIPAPNDELKGKVVDEIEKGYYLNDKIIRFAKVVIGE
ncbi:MAG: nucleotide exchange factor GrpE [Bacteroidetes bacterium GWA2_30_7]|nr:MAG: nucleotide exchange factor GrpE [Bacteroidetes bacterium GWA2_30_7]